MSTFPVCCVMHLSIKLMCWLCPPQIHADVSAGEPNGRTKFGRWIPRKNILRVQNHQNYQKCILKDLNLLICYNSYRHALSYIWLRLIYFQHREIMPFRSPVGIQNSDCSSDWRQVLFDTYWLRSVLRCGFDYVSSLGGVRRWLRSQVNHSKPLLPVTHFTPAERWSRWINRFGWSKGLTG